jgi:hypothetical protein
MPVLGSEAGRQRLDVIAELFRRAGLGEFRLTADGPEARVEAPAAEGSQREAAAQLVGHLLRTEQEMQSLCAEILERYEEAILVYRLCERLATAVGEPTANGQIVAQAVGAMGARAGELWLRDSGEVITLAAALPAPAPGEPPELREHGPLSVLTAGRPWVREPAPGLEAVAAVALPGLTGVPLGVLVLRGRSEGRSYGTSEIKLLTALSGLASAFLRIERRAGSREAGESA